MERVAIKPMSYCSTSDRSNCYTMAPRAKIILFSPLNVSSIETQMIRTRLVGLSVIRVWYLTMERFLGSQITVKATLAKVATDQVRFDSALLFFRCCFCFAEVPGFEHSTFVSSGWLLTSVHRGDHRHDRVDAGTRLSQRQGQAQERVA